MKKLILTLAILGFLNSALAHNEKVIKLEINEDGSKPEKITAKRGEYLILLVTRTTDETCMTELKKLNGTGQVELPLNKEVRFEVGKLKKAGEVKLLCGMDMTAGVVQVL